MISSSAALSRGSNSDCFSAVSALRLANLELQTSFEKRLFNLLLRSLAAMPFCFEFILVGTSWNSDTHALYSIATAGRRAVNYPSGTTRRENVVRLIDVKLGRGISSRVWVLLSSDDVPARF